MNLTNMFYVLHLSSKILVYLLCEEGTLGKVYKLANFAYVVRVIPKAIAT